MGRRLALVCCALSSFALIALAGPACQAKEDEVQLPASASARNTLEPRETAELNAFSKRVEAYVALRRKLKATLPALKTTNDPNKIEAQQRILATLIKVNRPKARQGEIFTPATGKVFRKLIHRAVKRDRDLKISIEDEDEERPVAVAVNGLYPESAPVATVPPQVLLSLPSLPDELEYRFVGRNLILLDHDPHVVVDYLPHALG